MDIKKILLLLAASVLISGIVVFRVNSTRKRGSNAAMPTAQSGNPTIPPVVPAPVQNTQPPGVVASAAPLPVSPLPEQPPAVVVQIPIPAVGWGRNPFLTPEEIAKILAGPPPAPRIAIKIEDPVEPVTPPPVVVPPPPILPAYVVSAIVLDKRGPWALIGSKQIRVGDKLGVESVKDITSGAVVLESEGKTRRLPVGSPAAGSGGISLSSDGRLEDRK